jgi:putative flippase GtrA
MINIILKYIIFAIIATVANLFSQFLFLKYYCGKGSLLVAMIIGTFIGIIIKYILDKNFIFYYVINEKNKEAKKFYLYSIIGVFTTLIFWSFEISFNIIFKNEIAKYFGALLGLSIGYILKYTLDKKIVFK